MSHGLGKVDVEPQPGGTLCGTLHMLLAFDWGDEIDLAAAGRLIPGRPTTLARRPRTPASIMFRPSPLRIPLNPLDLELCELGQVEVAAELTLFDFAAVSLALRVPVELTSSQLASLAGTLYDTSPLVEAARRALEPVFEKLKPVIRLPAWSELSEEYFVFQLLPGGEFGAPERLIAERAEWLATLLRLEDTPLSSEEVAEALRLRMSYGRDDLAIVEWPAAVVIDRDCDETLQTIEFANLQLLEYRHLDDRLDSRLAAAHKVIHPLVGSPLPFWRTYGRQRRALGELRMETRDIVERTENALKLVGDQYLARLHAMLATRFHLRQWEASIERSLAAAESVYEVISDQASALRAESLEWIIIFLIAFEIVMAFWK